MINYINISLFLLLLNQIKTSNTTYLVYELKTLEPKDKIESLLSFNSTYTTLEVGTPPQKVNFYFTLDHHEVTLTNKNCLAYNLFYPNKSSTLKQPFNIEPREGNSKHEFVYVDKLNFLGNIEDNEYINVEFPFLSLNRYNIIDSTYLCGNIGLSIMQYEIYKPEDKNLRKIYNDLNRVGIEKNDDFSFFHYNGKDYLIYGIILQKIFPQKFIDIEDIIWFSPTMRTNSYTLYWEMSMKSVTYNNVNSNSNPITIFEINPIFELIIGTNIFKDNIIKDFFKEYINKNICSLKNYKDYNNFNIIECNKDKFKINDIKKFPTISLTNIGLEYIFELKGEELFIELNNKWYFQIIFPEINLNPERWVLGRIFLRKYYFTFSPYNRLFGFYIFKDMEIKRKKEKNKDEKKIVDQINNKNTKDYFGYGKIIIIALIFTIVGILIGRKIFKMRTKRANELVDDFYQYDSEQKDIKKDNLNSNTNIEMNSKLGIK